MSEWGESEWTRAREGHVGAFFTVGTGIIFDVDRDMRDMTLTLAFVCMKTQILTRYLYEDVEYYCDILSRHRTHTITLSEILTLEEFMTPPHREAASRYASGTGGFHEYEAVRGDGDPDFSRLAEWARAGRKVYAHYMEGSELVVIAGKAKFYDFTYYKVWRRRLYGSAAQWANIEDVRFFGDDDLSIYLDNGNSISLGFADRRGRDEWTGRLRPDGKWERPSLEGGAMTWDGLEKLTLDRVVNMIRHPASGRPRITEVTVIPGEALIVGFGESYVVIKLACLAGDPMLKPLIGSGEIGRAYTDGRAVCWDDGPRKLDSGEVFGFLLEGREKPSGACR